jgi:hypothetical protein
VSTAAVAASTDFSAALILFSFLIYRCALQRRFLWSFDPACWLILWSLTASVRPVGHSLAT